MLKIYFPHKLNNDPTQAVTTVLVNIFSRLDSNDVEFWAPAEEQSDFSRGAIFPMFEKKINRIFLLINRIRKFRKLKPDFLLGVGEPVENIFLFFKPAKTKYIMSFHGVYNGEYQFKSVRQFLLWQSVKRLAKCARVIIAVSKYAAKTITDAFPARKIYVAYNGVDVDFFTPAKAERDKIVSRYGFSADKPIVIFVGEMIDRKRPGLVLDLARRCLEVNFVMVGRAKEFDVAKEIENISNVRWVELLERRDLAVLFASSDVFILTSVMESFGLVTVEAMASGLPVIATNHGATNEIVEDGKNGFLIARDEEEVESFTLQLKKLFSDNRVREEMGRYALRSVSEKFDWRVSARRYAEIFEELERDFKKV